MRKGTDRNPRDSPFLSFLSGAQCNATRGIPPSSAKSVFSGSQVFQGDRLHRFVNVQVYSRPSCAYSAACFYVCAVWLAYLMAFIHSLKRANMMRVQYWLNQSGKRSFAIF